MQSVVRRLLHNTEGATAVEYGLLVGIIALSLIAGFQAFTDEMVSVYTIINGQTANAAAKNS